MRLARQVLIDHNAAKRHPSHVTALLVLRLRNLWPCRISTLKSVRIQFSPASTIWWHFVPVMNLVRLYQAMAEMWNGSEPNAQVPWSFTRFTPTLLKVWWATWIAGVTLDRVEERWFSGDLAISSALFIVSGVLFIRILTGLARRQTLRRRSLEAAGRFPWRGDVRGGLGQMMH